MGDRRLINWTFYASGSFGLWLLASIISSLTTYRYDPGLPSQASPFLLSSALVGIAQLVGRTVGAFAQPIMGHLSDVFRSRWGKRRPFLAVGAFPLAVCFFLLFMPPVGWGSLGNIAYLLVLLCLFYLFSAVYYIPYLGWLPTIAIDSQQRVIVSTLIAFSSLAGTAVGGVGAPWLVSKLGFDKMAAIAGGIGAIALLLPLAIPEQLQAIKRKPSIQTPWKIVLDNSAFRNHLTGLSLDWIAITILSTCITYAAVALFQKDVGFGGVFYAVFLGGATIAFPIVIAAAKRYDKNFTLSIATAWSGLGLILLGLWSLFFDKNFLIWLLLLFGSSFGWAGFFIIPNAILPDLIGKQPGLGQVDSQREAVYFGIRGLLIEISIGIGSLAAGLILTLGKTVDRPLGVQLSILVAGALTLISTIAFVKKR